MDLLASQQTEPLSVSEACEKIKGALSQIDGGQPLQVRGEIGQFRPPQANKHWYFSLRDAAGNKLECSFFLNRRKQSGIDFEPEQGMEVIAEGHVEYYSPFGKVSLILSKLSRVGKGTLHEQFEELRRDLQLKGWFSEEIKRPLPTFARRIAVLTSQDGAVRHDIERTARTLWPGVELVLIPIPVQGEQAPAAIARAIEATHAAAKAMKFEAAILARGGGSLEDLWAFNTLPVLEAIYYSREKGSELPFVAAIGHESDTTLAELVSDFRASTPTAAAVRLVPSAAQHGEAIAAEKNRLQRVVHQLSKQASLRLEHLSKHFTDRRGAAVLFPHRERLLVLSRKLEGAASPSARLSGCQARLAQQEKRLSQAQRVSIDRRLERLEARRRQLAAIAPDRVLSRGYSLTTDQEGRVIRRSDAVAVGTSITTRLAQGALRSQVLPPEVEGE